MGKDLRYGIEWFFNSSATLRQLEYHVAPKGFIDIAGVWTQPAPHDPGRTKITRRPNSTPQETFTYMGVSKNNATPKSSILIGFSMKF